MRPRLALRHAAFRLRSRSLLSPAVIGLCIWLGFPSQLAQQDVAGIVLDLASSGSRWGAFIEKSAAGSVQQAEMRFRAGDGSGEALAGAAISAPGVGQVAFLATEAVVNAVPDEERVNRAAKQARVARVVPMAPPKAFSAGSLFERRAALIDTATQNGMLMAFAQTPIKGKEIRIARAFHPKASPADDPRLPAMVAALVNNDTPDILATAYAPAEPDYEKKSPFASLLKDEAPDAGRFIPPMEPGDHDWVKRPLPPTVFSKGEQQCLTAGVYFEARGESVKGQAAVAQVILNRVRNPAYPATVCGVVYQNDKWRNACQFSFACDGIKDRVANKEHWSIAEDIAMAVTAGKIWLPEVGSSTHYHATYVHPSWARTMEKMKKIGRHIFYRTYGGGWS